MPEVTVDGQPFAYEGDQKALQFCLNHGVELPHFCYHPALSIPANCRQCLVEIGTPEKDRETGEVVTGEDGEPEIQWMPQLQTACSIDVSDGMRVKTHRTSPKVRRAQKDNLEFLLVNHPLDCPICDQAGHCPLQIQAYKYGPEGSRFEFRKVHKPKRVELGLRVTLDAERCINCTRCTRFTDEVSGSHQLSIMERGVKNYPMTAPGASFDDPYSMNTIDLCPVGALTATDFRFRARIWEMSSTPSITTSNATGANCHYWVRDNEVLRITPRQNRDVNEYWLPDEDRLVYPSFNENRPPGPSFSEPSGRDFTDWEAAYERVADVLGGLDGENILFLGSARATVEDNFLLVQLADAMGAEPPRFIEHVEPGAGDDWLVTDDKTPNADGCRRLGMTPVDEALLRSQLEGGQYEAVYVMEDDPVGAGLVDRALLDDAWVVLHHYHTTNRTLPVADVALPAAMVVETVGTYVNQDGRAQRVRPAKAIKGVNRTLMMEMGKSREDQHGTPFDRWHNDENRVDCKPGWTSLPALAEHLGHAGALDFKSPTRIMAHVAESNAAFAGATYEAMGLRGVPLEDVGDQAAV